MNRTILYDEEQADPFDILWALKDVTAAIGGVVTSLSGSKAGLMAGFAPLATSPASLAVNLAAGIVFQQAPFDSSAYGALPSDSTIIEQQGYAPAQSILLSTVGLSAGQSMWALVEAQFSQVDEVRPGDPTGGVLNYWNANNPTEPFQGPNNDGSSQPTVRLGTVAIKVIYGAPATTGSEVPPQPDAGWLPLYLIDLAFNQTTVVQGQILTATGSAGANVPSNYPTAPFIAGLLNAHHNGKAGQAPQIDLAAEVKNLLPLVNTTASNTSGGGLPVMKLHAGNPNGNVAGNANVNGASDFCFDITNLLLYICTATGTSSTAVWTAVVGQSTSIFIGGTSTGSANAQVIGSTTPAGFARLAGQVVTFNAGFTNTGATTLNVDATGAAAIQKNTGSGNVALSGGEIVTGNFITVIWTGTVYLLEATSLGALATMGIGAFLKNDGSGNLTVNNGTSLGNLGDGKLSVLASGVTPATYTAPKITVGADGRVSAAASGGAPTRTVLSATGAGTYNTPANCVRLQVRMVAGGGGGGGGGGASGDGLDGGGTSFGGVVCNAGLGGISTTNGSSAGARGGTGGQGGTGGGTSFPGALGLGGSGWVGTANQSVPGGGGASIFGGAGATQSRSSGFPAATNSGSGGGGGGTDADDTGSAGGGGAGEGKEFQVLSPGATITYNVGTGGAGGTAGTSGFVGGNGGAGRIIIDEFYY